MARTHPADPFDFPLSIIPRGLTYQWCAKEVLGDPHPQFKAMKDAGWTPVPGKRHPGVFRKLNADGEVEVGGQVLMCRPTEVTKEAKEKTDDDAHRNAGASYRTVDVVLDVTVRLSRREMDVAAACGISCHEYTLRRLRMMTDGLDPNSSMVGVDVPASPALRFATTRRPVRPWLRWLFNLISTEQ